jgi:dTDP-4-amino-4,6-dideoxy-D-galactose acyltransferase
MNKFQILQWDSDLFGYNVANILASEPTLKEFDTLIGEMKNQHIKLAYWSTSNSFNLQDEISKKHNGLLVDLKTTYCKVLSEKNDDFKIDEHATIFPGNKPDSSLYEIALQCGEYSRFRNDLNIPYTVFKKMYNIWIEKSASKELADDILIYNVNNEIAGLVTLYVKDSVGHIGLIGVHSNFRGKGIGSKLIIAAIEYFKKAGCKSIEVVTQGLNKAACALYEKNGFSIKSQFSLYHFWLIV